MKSLILAAFSRSRTMVMLFVLILVTGAVSYVSIPKESEPDVQIPIIYVSVTHEGISPEDAERLLIRPLEKELQTIEGIQEMRSRALEGYASVTLYFDAGFNPDTALQDVRDRVDVAKVELPPDSDEPAVHEINVALFPVLTVVLSGTAPERTLLNVAKDLRDRIEALPGVLEADMGGEREEVLEIIVDPSVMETYHLQFEDVFNLLQRNNRLVAAGALDRGAGRMVIKVPGVLEDVEDVLNLPVKVANNTVVTFRDVATVNRTFKDPDGFARVDGQPAVVLEVSKRSGANIIETIEQVQAIVAAESEHWPAGIQFSFMQDKSQHIREMLGDLQNNVIAAIILVMIVVVAALGIRPGVLVGLAIPGSFLAGILVLHLMGLTMNLVVLFALILVVGMLVDGAIVTIELADRKVAQGMDRKTAYAQASIRMAWPVIASTATTLVVFGPLLFWPGIVGEFMSYLPLTVIVTLAASLSMALIFIPVLGGLIGSGNRNGHQVSQAATQQTLESEGADDGFDDPIITPRQTWYIRSLTRLLRHPGKTFVMTVFCLIGTYVAYGAFGKGVEFFPDMEPEFVQVQIQARGDLSVQERDTLVKQVERRLLRMDGVKTVYSRTFGGGKPTKDDVPEDVVGILQMEFIEWSQRDPASVLMAKMRDLTADIPGILIQVRKQQNGPDSGKPVEIQISSRAFEKLAPAIGQVRKIMNELGGFVDVEDNRPLPSIEWRVKVDREQAALYGADVTLLGDAIRMVTNGVQLAEYRPDDADEELDIRLRFPIDERNLERLGQLRVPTKVGQVPIRNFISVEPSQKTGAINRTDGKRVMLIKADVAEGVLPDQQVKRVKAELANVQLDPDVTVEFRGQNEDQGEAATFLIGAFFTALFLMTVILVTQFNSFYQALLVLSAIVFSTAGVLIGLMLTSQPFSIVMGGIAIIALAGIVVNNNIVLIDTYNIYRKRGLDAMDAILLTASLRLRPILLTAGTTVLGLMPMVFAMNIDLIGRDISFGAPSTQWWRQLSSAIAGGLGFATLLTLVLTPCLLMLGSNVGQWWQRRFNPSAVNEEASTPLAE